MWFGPSGRDPQMKGEKFGNKCRKDGKIDARGKFMWDPKPEGEKQN